MLLLLLAAAAGQAHTYRQRGSETSPSIYILWSNAYNLPLSQDIFDQLGGSSVFSTLDLKSGFFQFPIAEEDKEKTAFTCHRGLFE